MHFRTLSLTLLLLLPGFALAHAELNASSIEDGATLTQKPTEVSLTFSEAAELGFSTFKVYPLSTQAATAEPASTEEHGDTEGHDGAATSDDHDGAEAEDADNHDAAATSDDHAADTEKADSSEDGGSHGALDAAAETLMADVIGVKDDAEVRADTGVTPSSGQSETVTLPLKSDLAPGAYAVMWKVLSVDSHAIEGFLTFTYEPGE